MTSVKPEIEDSWKELLTDQFAAPYFTELKGFLVDEKSRFSVYPPGSLIFSAFNLTPADKVKVVILGQDPYHGAGQAHGLCFSVPDGIKPPPSLANIYKELNSDLGIPVPSHGNLEKWARQGVLLLNATLTVRAGQAGSHQNRGWETFTDAVITSLSRNSTGIVFMLWGRYAQAKEGLIDTSRHRVLKAAHPSPFSAASGFFGCRHFSRANRLLEESGREPVDWSL
ncbi:MAG: uracil-DNA glycosylase [Marinilabiliales bacterium]|nr:MAG: uracil-DNA glycosylase [Marinilabiliales bacterium]